MISAAFSAWVEDARAVTCDDVAVAHGLSLSPPAGTATRSERAGPCPACGGTDRFAINPVKNVFLCRQCGAAGDAIALQQLITGADFRAACEALTGRPAPDGRAGEGPDPAEMARRTAKKKAAAEAATRAAEKFRADAIERGRRIWDEAGPAEGTDTEGYWRLRGLTVPVPPAIRHHPAVRYTEMIDGRWQVLHDGPAQIAAIMAPDGHFAGAHITWLDLARPNGKLHLLDAAGKARPAKKIWGAHKGCAIRLVDGPAPLLVVGEGIEKTAAIASVDGGAAWPAGIAYWSGISLGNIAGKATESRPHPRGLKAEDKAGRLRTVRVRGPDPADDPDALMLPDWCDSALYLVDSTSEEALTAWAMARAIKRNARAGRTIQYLIAPDGCDFDDVLRGAA